MIAVGRGTTLLKDKTSYDARFIATVSFGSPAQKLSTAFSIYDDFSLVAGDNKDYDDLIDMGVTPDYGSYDASDSTSSRLIEADTIFNRGVDTLGLGYGEANSNFTSVPRVSGCEDRRSSSPLLSACGRRRNRVTSIALAPSSLVV